MYEKETNGKINKVSRGSYLMEIYNHIPIHFVANKRSCKGSCERKADFMRCQSKSATTLEIQQLEEDLTKSKDFNKMIIQ